MSNIIIALGYILLFLIFFYVTISETDEQDELLEVLDINQLFPSFHDLNTTIDLPKGTFKNITVDIEKLDLEKFIKKLDRDLKDKIKEADDFLIRNSRRQVLVYNSTHGKSSFLKASYHMQKQKAMDMMLQFIYMARHILRRLESDEYFSRTDTGYRIGFLYRKLNAMRRKMVFILAYMHKNNFQRENVTTHLVLHHRVVKIHTDFLYYWWAMIRVDGIYKIRTNAGRKIPKALKDVIGVSSDSSEEIPTTT